MSVDQMETALRLIGGDCKRSTRGLCPDDPNLGPYAVVGAYRWCDPCIARAGLAGTLPARPEAVPLDPDDFSYYGDPADLEESCDCGCDGDCA